MASTEPSDAPGQGGSADIDRVVTLTDGVIAIAITLLVLDIAVPEIPDALVSDELGEALWDLRPQVYGFLLSFALIAYYWLSHRLVFSHLRRIDLTLTVINFCFLLMVAFIPFAAALLADYHPDSLAVAVYAGIMALAGIAQLAIYVYPSVKGHLHPSVSSIAAQVTTRKVAVAPLVFLVSIPVAFLNGWAAMALWLLIPIGRLMVRRRAKARLDAASPA